MWNISHSFLITASHPTFFPSILHKLLLYFKNVLNHKFNFYADLYALTKHATHNKSLFLTDPCKSNIQKKQVKTVVWVPRTSRFFSFLTVPPAFAAELSQVRAPWKQVLQSNEKKRVQTPKGGIFPSMQQRVRLLPWNRLEYSKDRRTIQTNCSPEGGGVFLFPSDAVVSRPQRKNVGVGGLFTFHRFLSGIPLLCEEKVHVCVCVFRIFLDFSLEHNWPVSSLRSSAPGQTSTPLANTHTHTHFLLDSSTLESEGGSRKCDARCLQRTLKTPSGAAAVRALRGNLRWTALVGGNEEAADVSFLGVFL